MKVLTTADGKTILTFNPAGGTEFLGLDGKTYGRGKVAALPDATVRTAIRAALPKSVTSDADHPFAFTLPTEVLKDLKWIAKGLIPVPDGTEGVGLIASKRGVALDIPADALPKKAPVNVGDRIAVMENISPAAWMNARGTVKAITGGKVTIALTDGDRARIERKTGKRVAAEVNLPLVCVEVDAA